MDAKYICRFCGRSNTKIEPITRGLFSVKVGQQEVIDKTKTYYRCVDCGLVMCKDCCEKQHLIKKRVGLLSTKVWTVCPHCDGDMINLTN
jgi:hypothetical protein